MPIILTDADKRKLVGVDARLVTVVYHVAERTDIPFIVVEGVRTLARQRDLLKQRKTKTLKSNHVIGRAVDCAPRSVLGKVPWPYEDFRPLVDCAKQVSVELGIAMEFGFDWGWDAPHWELK